MNCRTIEAIIIKDRSRLGRDYLKVGQVMEILRQKGISLIAKATIRAEDMARGVYIPVSGLPLREPQRATNLQGSERSI